MTKRKSTPKLQKSYCDRAWSNYIRARGECQRCGTRNGPFEAAHIVRRRFAWTRTNETNGWCLCHECHQTVDTHDSEFMALVMDTIGLDALRALEQKSLNRAKFDWFAEHERLKALVKEAA